MHCIWFLLLHALMARTVLPKRKIISPKIISRKIISKEHYTRQPNCYQGSEQGFMVANLLLLIDDCFMRSRDHDKTVVITEIEDVMQNLNIVYENTFGIRTVYTRRFISSQDRVFNNINNSFEDIQYVV
jgi:hypothetical protein